MGLLRKLRAPGPAAAPPTVADSLQQLITNSGQDSLFAHSEFVKQVECSRCGAPKRLPSKTAYLYCDHCGALVGYDFRLANLGTNSAYTNTVYHQLITPVQAEINKARAFGDNARYRDLNKAVYLEWLRQCPQAASPRVASDEDFRERMATYLTECMVVRDFDVYLATLDAQFKVAVSQIVRIPQPNGRPWLVSAAFWPLAELWKQQMEAAYRLLDETGVSALDPDEAPPGVQLRMEHSTFCQGWLPHLTPADGERMLAMYGLKSEYARVNVPDAQDRNCGGCGGNLKVLPGAQAVVCESCGRKLDIAGGERPCQTCGASLSFPVGVSRIDCPYCQSETHRI
jgi:DNA-directed RNA polymerase subunit RPC12/RpoP